MLSRRSLRLSLLLTIALTMVAPSRADSITDLISGFDVARIDSAYPNDDESSRGELAKLVYRLLSIDRQSLLDRVASGPELNVGDAARVSGRVVALETIAVPPDLVEYLELAELHRLTIAIGRPDDNAEVEVIVGAIDDKLQVGDQIDAVGVVLESDQGTFSAFAIGELQWFPRQVPNGGWQLLRDAGVDIGLVAELPKRDRRPLVAEDGDAFYAMLAAAKSVADRDLAAGDERFVEPRNVEPLAMLQSPDKLVGDWIQVELETVQITQVFVTNRARQTQIGSDHYFQIDSVGDLENVIVNIEPRNPEDQPTPFEGRYPVSLVMLELPDFLQQRIAESNGSRAVVTPVRVKISVQAFFFRLWSYQSEFMDQHGGGNQFGPLLIGASLSSREPAPSDPVGLGLIGIGAAIAVIGAILATFLWHRKTSAEDRAVRKERQNRESERIRFPADRA